MYFYYGITHSTLENPPTEEIELTVDQSYLQTQSQPKPNNDHHQPTAVWDRHGYENKMAEDSWSTQNNYTSSWDTNETNRAWGNASNTSNASGNNLSYRQPAAPSPKPKTSQTAAVPPKPSHAPPLNMKREGFGSIFVDESEFPKWED